MFKSNCSNSKHYPKKLAIENALESVRNNIEEAPEGIITVPLPAKINSDPSSWEKRFEKNNDGNIILHFECIRREYNIKSSTKSLVIE